MGAYSREYRTQVGVIFITRYFYKTKMKFILKICTHNGKFKDLLVIIRFKTLIEKGKGRQ